MCPTNKNIISSLNSKLGNSFVFIGLWAQYVRQPSCICPNEAIDWLSYQNTNLHRLSQLVQSTQDPITSLSQPPGHTSHVNQPRTIGPYTDLNRNLNQPLDWGLSPTGPSIHLRTRNPAIYLLENPRIKHCRAAPFALVIVIALRKTKP